MYITINEKRNQNPRAMPTIEDILNGIVDFNQTEPQNDGLTHRKTFINDNMDALNNLLNTRVAPERLYQIMHELREIAEPYIGTNLSQHYDSFSIPKRTGGLRRIDAPHDDLKFKLLRVKQIIESDLKVLPHEAAHAYTAQRSTITAIQTHQKNNSKWFLKLDLKDFFPSHNLEYIMAMLEKIYPFGVLLQQAGYREIIKNVISIGLLNNGLPQGTPLSPTLTNLLMVPIDYEIKKALPTKIYTRYADDLLISSQYDFQYTEVVQKIKEILRNFNAPFQIKDEKTHYGSSAGRNWNLGIMLNKDNKTTIGHKQNQRLRAMIFAFMKDLTNGIIWDRMDVQQMIGLISYYKMIEPEYVTATITKYDQKFNRSFLYETKCIINGTSH